MIIKGIRTSKVLPSSITLFELLNRYLDKINDNSVLAITSKIVSLCEGRVVPFKSSDKDNLVKQESSYYLPSNISKYGYHFTITNKTLISMSGIDESNGNGNYILWPSNPQETANSVREHILKRFNLKNIGVVIVDSTCTPLRLGTSGIALSYSGFSALNDYIGKPDLFGRPFSFSQANVAGGLAAAAVLVMGEGTEQTPLALIEDIPFVSFQNHNPTAKDLEAINIERENDLFAPFFDGMDWLKGEKN